jgi:hypothetical protein
MLTTKQVENILRTSIEKSRGSSPPPNVSSERLLNYALGGHLLRDKRDPLYSLMFWLFKEPRNTSHHEFRLYPYNYLVQSMSEANFAIRNIKTRTISGYMGNFSSNFNQSDTSIEWSNVRIRRPGNTPLSLDQKVEGLLKFQDGSFKNVSLVSDGVSGWKGKYDARGDRMGTVWVGLRVVEQGNYYNISSGYAINATPTSGKSCTACGRTVYASRCPYCGNPMYL